MQSFMDRVLTLQKERETRLCVGIDAVATRMPSCFESTRVRSVLEFYRSIVEATATCACVFKINYAFLAALDAIGILPELIREIQEKYHTPVIVDGKRGDIATSAQMYAREMFNVLGADAATVNAYMGPETLNPWLDHGPQRGIFVLARTSNQDAFAIQDCTLNALVYGLDHKELEHPAVWQRVALLSTAKQTPNSASIGLVMGATTPEQIGGLYDYI